MGRNRKAKKEEDKYLATHKNKALPADKNEASMATIEITNSTGFRTSRGYSLPHIAPTWGKLDSSYIDLQRASAFEDEDNKLEGIV